MLTRLHARPVLAMFACVLLGSIALAGCGSDSSADSAADAKAKAKESAEKAAAATKDAVADAEVTAYTKGLEAAGKILTAAGTKMEQADDWASYSAALIQLKAAVQTFHVLVPPSSVESEHTEMVDALDTAVAEASKVTANSSEAADAEATAAALASLEAASTAADSLFEKLG